MAVDVRFELTDPFGSSVFKADAIDHSANPPYYRLTSISASGSSLQAFISFSMKSLNA